MIHCVENTRSDINSSTATPYNIKVVNARFQVHGVSTPIIASQAGAHDALR